MENTRRSKSRHRRCLRFPVRTNVSGGDNGDAATAGAAGGGFMDGGEMDAAGVDG